MNRPLSILILAFFLGGVYTHAQQPTAILTPTANNANGPIRFAQFGTAQGGGWANAGQVNWRLSFANLPPNANVAATVTVRYQPRQGNTSVVSFEIPPNTAQPGSPLTQTYNGANNFVITFNRNRNDPGAQGLLCGTYTISVTFILNGQSGNGTALETGDVKYAGTRLQQHQNQQNQQNQSVFPGPQQQSGGIGSRVQGRGSVVVLRRRYNPRSGTVEIIKNGIITRYGFLNFQGGNRRQKLRNCCAITAAISSPPFVRYIN